MPPIPWPPLPPGLGSGGTEGSPADGEGPQRRLRGAKLNRGAPKGPSSPVICALGVGKSTKSYIITDFTKLRLRARICLSALSTLTEILIPSLLPCEVVMIVPIVQMRKLLNWEGRGGPGALPGRLHLRRSALSTPQTPLKACFRPHIISSPCSHHKVPLPARRTPGSFCFK